MIGRPRVACVSAIVLVAAGCGSGGTPLTFASTSTPPPPLDSVELAATDARPASTAAPHMTGATSTSASNMAPATTAAVWVVGDVLVADGDLPSELVEAFVAAGGDLVAPGEWERRFGYPAGFPKLTGSSARVVGALYRIESAESGDDWLRTDEMSWLVADGRDRDELLAHVASMLGAARGDWEPTSSIHDGADCLAGKLATAVPGEWTLQGCSYPRFGNLVTVGLSRTTQSETGPGLIDPTVAAVTSGLGGRPVFSEVRLGQPGADGSTLRLSTQVRFDDPIDVTAAADGLIADVLPGWQLLRGDGSVLLSGPTGGTWTITSTVAVFEWAGRW